MVSKTEAAARAELGYPGIATYQSMDRARPGHVAVVVPSDVMGEVRIAQAGRENFISGPLARGFGVLPVTFWVHN